MITKMRPSNLENAFFLEQDKLLIKKLAELKKMQESKETLRAVSGITNEHILEKLVNLNITPQSVAALTVVPLIEVAWADGHVDENEKSLILSQIEKHGIKKGSVEHDLTELWLTHKPDDHLLTAWAHLVEDICSKMNKTEKKEFQESLLRDTHAIANSSGGFLGLGKISKAEKAILKKLEHAF
jgi:hypothetical protein